MKKELNKKVTEKENPIKNFLIACGSVLAIVIGGVTAEEKGDSIVGIAGFCLLGIGIIGAFVFIAKNYRNENKGIR